MTTATQNVKNNAKTTTAINEGTINPGIDNIQLLASSNNADSPLNRLRIKQTAIIINTCANEEAFELLLCIGDGAWMQNVPQQSTQ